LGRGEYLKGINEEKNIVRRGSKNVWGAIRPLWGKKVRLEVANGKLFKEWAST